LDAALQGVDAVVDAIGTPPISPDETRAYLGTTTRNLLAAEERAGVRHHVLLSIVGIHRLEGNAHYTGKREQERLIAEFTVPWTIVPATQFHDFAALVTKLDRARRRRHHRPLLVQPIAPADIANILAEVATGEPQGRYVDVASPETQDLVDMARRTNEVRGLPAGRRRLSGRCGRSGRAARHCRPSTHRTRPTRWGRASPCGPAPDGPVTCTR
jgi:uncharacterized protein YbjT (DUF2867 family)